jgi:hypothetical protein
MLFDFKHADFYDLPDDTRYNASANSSNQKIKLLEEVTIDDPEQSQQTIHLADLEFRGDRYPVHQPEGHTHD